MLHTNISAAHALTSTAVRPVSSEIRPVGRPRTAHLKPQIGELSFHSGGKGYRRKLITLLLFVITEKRPRGRPRKSAEAYGVIPYTTATVPSSNGVYAAFTGSMLALAPRPVDSAGTESSRISAAGVAVKVESVADATAVSGVNKQTESSSCLSSTFLY